MNKNYSLTVKACSAGYLVQAVANNLLPLLFVYLTTKYSIPVYLISVLLAYNFGLQILIDSLSSNIASKLGYRKTALLSASLAGFGLLILSFIPFIFKSYLSVYFGLLVSVSFMASGSGISELILSSLLEALPIENKQQKMSLIHSFYCLGHILLVGVATAFFIFIGIDKWYYLPLILLLLPILMFTLFTKCPVLTPSGDENPISKFKIIKNKNFILVFLLMICAGAIEQAVAQWISYFAESGLKVQKSLGDVIGVGAFALTMFISRVYFANTKKNYDLLKVVLVFASLISVCLILSFAIDNEITSLILLAICGLFIGVMWPGIYSVGGKTFTRGGTAMFSLLALGGDLGCTLGPTIVGGVAEVLNIKIGILSSLIFSLTMVVLVLIIFRRKKKGTLEDFFEN